MKSPNRMLRGGVDSKTAIVISAVVVVLAVIAAVLVFFMRGKETHTSTDQASGNTSALSCVSKNPSDPFFKVNVEQSPSHQIKIMFRGEVYDKFNYTYNAKFASDTESEKASAMSHTDYNLYMTSIGIDPEDLYPTFSDINKEVIINLFIPRNRLTIGTARFLFMNEKDFDAIDHYKIEDFKRMYGKKGFTCQYVE